MARKRKPEIKEKDLHGFKHFKLLLPVLERLHGTARESDRAGNRILHFDQYAALILLYFFNPIVSRTYPNTRANGRENVEDHSV